MISKSRVTILVKASPQPSRKHAETVCCAGLEEDGTWRRLYPIRFRQLSGDKAFSRWDIVEYSYNKPNDDSRIESCRVHEESISIVGKIKKDLEKSALIERALIGSEKAAVSRSQSLAVIRPTNLDLKWKRLTTSELDEARSSFSELAQQLSLLDEELRAYEPCPYKFTMHYRDEGGPHTKTCADWETHATFFNFRQNYGEEAALKHIQETYCQTYVKKGVVFALGNMKKRPQTYQLLGIFPVAPERQPDLFS